MTLQTRGYSWSVGIHGLVMMAAVILQLAVGAQTRVAVVDFTLGDNRPAPVVEQSPQQKMTEPTQEAKLPMPCPNKDREEQAPSCAVSRTPDPPPLSLNGEEATIAAPQAALSSAPTNAAQMSRKDSAMIASQDTGEVAAGSGRATEAEQAKATYLKEHFAYIRDRIIKNIRYPHMARKMGWCGLVKIAFVICEDGSVNEVSVVNSSGFSMLDRNAVDTVNNVAPFPSPPVKAEIRMAINYRLN